MNESLLESEDIIISRNGNNFVLKTALKTYGTSVIKSAPVKRKDTEPIVKKISSDCGNIYDQLSVENFSTQNFFPFLYPLQTSSPLIQSTNPRPNHFYPTLK